MYCDLESARSKVASAVDRRDAAVTARDLPLNDPRNEQREPQAGERKQAPVAAESRSWKTGAKARKCGRNHDVLMPYPDQIADDAGFTSFVIASGVKQYRAACASPGLPRLIGRA